MDWEWITWVQNKDIIGEGWVYDFSKGRTRVPPQSPKVSSFLTDLVKILYSFRLHLACASPESLDLGVVLFRYEKICCSLRFTVMEKLIEFVASR
ncbi:hypothetical protein V6N12_029651 [Hibiscus sabdariffa]|uniref:Uncharacterized protein n=1 Tax=Hibiscus sabdariffa TaxID=183260 RepID=A0ABR2CWR7_9ROSI